MAETNASRPEAVADALLVLQGDPEVATMTLAVTSISLPFQNLGDGKLFVLVTCGHPEVVQLTMPQPAGSATIGDTFLVAITPIRKQREARHG